MNYLLSLLGFKSKEQTLRIKQLEEDLAIYFAMFNSPKVGRNNAGCRELLIAENGKAQVVFRTWLEPEEALEAVRQHLKKE